MKIIGYDKETVIYKIKIEDNLKRYNITNKNTKILNNKINFSNNHFLILYNYKHYISEFPQNIKDYKPINQIIV